MSAISELGDRALREAKQNKIEGAGVFMSLLDQHPLVKAEVLNEAIVSFAANEMHKAAHRTRTPKKSNYRTLEKTGTDGAVSRMAFNLGDSLMDTWAMACNKPLGDVTVEELIAEAMTEERTAQGHTMKARFYRVLAKGVKGSGIVRDHWTDHRIQLAWGNL